MRVLRYLGFACVVMVIGIGAWVVSYTLRASPRPFVASKHTHIIHQQPLHMEVVTSTQDQMRGLGGRDTLAQDEGMLFVFPSLAIQRFWMKDMRFPIDIIWFDRGRVVDVQTLFPPQGLMDVPASYTPSAMSDMVLEVGAGQAARYGLTVGAFIPEVLFASL